MKHILANFSDILYITFSKDNLTFNDTHMSPFNHGKNNCQATRKYSMQRATNL